MRFCSHVLASICFSHTVKLHLSHLYNGISYPPQAAPCWTHWSSAGGWGGPRSGGYQLKCSTARGQRLPFLWPCSGCPRWYFKPTLEEWSPETRKHCWEWRGTLLQWECSQQSCLAHLLPMPQCLKGLGPDSLWQNFIWNWSKAVQPN